MTLPNNWPARKEHANNCFHETAVSLGNTRTPCTCGANAANAMLDQCAKAVEYFNLFDTAHKEKLVFCIKHKRVMENGICPKCEPVIFDLMDEEVLPADKPLVENKNIAVDGVNMPINDHINHTWIDDCRKFNELAMVKEINKKMNEGKTITVEDLTKEIENFAIAMANVKGIKFHELNEMAKNSYRIQANKLWNFGYGKTKPSGGEVATPQGLAKAYEEGLKANIHMPTKEELVQIIKSWSTNMSGYKHKAGLMIANEDFENVAEDILAKFTPAKDNLHLKNS